MTASRRLSVWVDRDHAEPLSALLFQLGVRGLEERAQGRQIQLCAYFETDAELSRATADITAQNPGIRYEVTRIDDDWRLSWTKHLKRVQLTPDLVLVPYTEAEPGPPPSGELWLAPALAFGFGEHPTTRMIARWLERRRSARRLLDVGCGTGVLCFVGVLAGVERSLGLDISKDACAAARRNANLNGLSERCQFAGDSGAPALQSGSFDVGVANIELAGLLEVAPLLAQGLAPGSLFALTGVLAEQVPEVCEAYAGLGMPCGLQATCEGWALVVGRRE
jgi:ribosomal protein L11 methyltransferase